MIYKNFDDFWDSIKTERLERMTGRECARVIFEELMIGYKPCNCNEKLLSYSEWLDEREKEEVR